MAKMEGIAVALDRAGKGAEEVGSDLNTRAKAGVCDASKLRAVIIIRTGKVTSQRVTTNGLAVKAGESTNGTWIGRTCLWAKYKASDVALPDSSLQGGVAGVEGSSMEQVVTDEGFATESALNTARQSRSIGQICLFLFMIVAIIITTVIIIVAIIIITIPIIATMGE